MASAACLVSAHLSDPSSLEDAYVKPLDATNLKFLDMTARSKADLQHIISRNPGIECVLFSSSAYQIPSSTNYLYQILTSMQKLHTLIIVGTVPICLYQGLFHIPQIRTIFDLTGRMGNVLGASFHDHVSSRQNQPLLRIYFLYSETGVVQAVPGYEFHPIPRSFNPFKAPLLRGLMPSFTAYPIQKFLQKETVPIVPCSSFGSIPYVSIPGFPYSRSPHHSAIILANVFLAEVCSGAYQPLFEHQKCRQIVYLRLKDLALLVNFVPDFVYMGENLRAWILWRRTKAVTVMNMYRIEYADPQLDEMSMVEISRDLIQSAYYGGLYLHMMRMILLAQNAVSAFYGNYDFIRPIVAKYNSIHQMELGLLPEKLFDMLLHPDTIPPIFEYARDSPVLRELPTPVESKLSESSEPPEQLEVAQIAMVPTHSETDQTLRNRRQPVQIDSIDVPKQAKTSLKETKPSLLMRIAIAILGGFGKLSKPIRVSGYTPIPSNGESDD